MRLIDADALLQNLEATTTTFDLERDASAQLMQDIRLVQNAPTIPTDGDAISRAGLLADFERYKSNHHPYTAHLSVDNCIANIKNFPALPSLPATPAPDVDGDRVTAEDVVEGIEFYDGIRTHHIRKCLPADVLVDWGGDIPGGGRWFSKKAVAAMLNAAESITWPEGHRLAPKKEPTIELLLNELHEARICGKVPNFDTDELNLLQAVLQAAIEREKGGKE